MHFLKKYPVNMLCIGHVRKIGQKESASQKTDVHHVSQNLHTAPSQSAQLLGDQETNLAIALNMQFKGFPEIFLIFYIFHYMPSDSPKGNISNLSHRDSCIHDIPRCYFG